MAMFQEARMDRIMQVNEVAPLVEDISRSVARNPGAMLSLTRLKTKDDYTYLHSVTVCDVHDAITSDRCYKKGWEPAEALKKMAEWKDGHFDENVFHAFVKSVGIYPTGALLKLKPGRLAAVMDQSAKSLLTPMVKIFYSCSAHALIPPKIIDLARQAKHRSIERPEPRNLDPSRVMAII